MTPPLVLLLVLYACTSVTALTLIKAGGHQPPNLLHMGLGASLYVCSFLMWIFILTKAELTVAFPMSVGLTILGTTLAGAAIFGETLTVPRLAGAGCVLLGAFLVTR
jgi:multidrug transporter EmrE-like cation transporter